MRFNALSTGQRALSMISVILNLINFTSSTLSLLVFDEIDNCGLDRENGSIVIKTIVDAISESLKVMIIDRDATIISTVNADCTALSIDAPFYTMKNGKAIRSSN